MALSCIPTPFGGCDLFQEQRLTTTDGVVLELAEVAHGRQLVVITLDMNQATPSAAATLAELFRPLVEANARGGGAAWPPPPGADPPPAAADVGSLDQVLYAADCAFVVLTPGPLGAVERMREELAFLTGGPELARSLPVALDVDACAARSLQLFGLDGRTVPAVFQLSDRLAIGFRQFGNAFAGSPAPLAHQLLAARACAERAADTACGLAQARPSIAAPPALTPRA
jgi:hypothetical protein